MAKRRNQLAHSIREDVLRAAHGRCAVCGRETSELQIDHIVPVSGGGDDSFENLQTLCPSCNAALHKEGTAQSLAKVRTGASKAYEFERAVVELFGQMGYGVMRGATGPDGGVDVVLRTTVAEVPLMILVECKYTSRPLSAAQISQFATKLQHYRGNMGILVTNRLPTGAGMHIARDGNIRVVTLDDLKALASEMEARSDG